MLSPYDEPERDTQLTQPRISLCMVLANDVDLLEDCLRSASPVVSDIVIAETKLGDRVRDLAEVYHASLIEVGRSDSRSELRNITLELAKGEWVLVLDADERLDACAGEKILQAARDPNADAYAFVFRNYMNAEPDSPYFVHRTCRMFRHRPEYRFVGKVYERVVPSIEAAGGVVAQIDAVVHHHGYRSDLLDWSRQHDRYMGSLRAALSHNPACLEAGDDLSAIYCPAEDFENSLAYLRKLSELVDTSSSPVLRR